MIKSQIKINRGMKFLKTNFDTKTSINYSDVHLIFKYLYFFQVPGPEIEPGTLHSNEKYLLKKLVRMD